MKGRETKLNEEQREDKYIEISKYLPGEPEEEEGEEGIKLVLTNSNLLIRDAFILVIVSTLRVVVERTRFQQSYYYYQ